MANKDWMEIIPWVIPDRETDLIKLTIQDTGDQGDHSKCYLHFKPLATTDINQLLYHIISFYSMIEDLDLQNTDKAFDAFKHTLGPTLKTTWTSMMTFLKELSWTWSSFVSPLKLLFGNFSWRKPARKSWTSFAQHTSHVYWLCKLLQTDFQNLINQWASWLEGHEANPILTEAQEKQGLHDSMPQVWCTKYSEMCGNLNVDMCAEIIEYFCECKEDSATHKEQNWCKQTVKKAQTCSKQCKELHVHTDHKNLMYTNLNSEHILCWRLFLKNTTSPMWNGRTTCLWMLFCIYQCRTLITQLYIKLLHWEHTMTLFKTKICLLQAQFLILCSQQNSPQSHAPDSDQGRFFSFSTMTPVLILWGSLLTWNLPCLAVLVSTTWNQCCEMSAYRTGASVDRLLQKFSAWYHLKVRSRSSRSVPSWCSLHFPFQAFWVIFLCAGTWTPVHKHW